MRELKLLCDIIQKELELENGQVYLYDQKINVPADEKLYIAVKIGSATPFGSSRKEASDDELGLVEVQTLHVRQTVDIDILSRGTDARERREEVILALKSTYSQTIQEKNGFHIASIPSGFVDLSGIEGAAIPYRFNVSVNLQYKIAKTKQIAYYDQYSDSVITEE